MTEGDYLDKLDGMWDDLDNEDVLKCALTLSAQAIDDYPDNPDLLCAHGRLLFASNVYSIPAEVDEYFKRAIRVSPGMPDPWTELGYLYDIDDNLPKALEYFERAVSLGDDDDAILGLARVLTQLGRKEEAMAWLDRSNSTDPDRVKQLRNDIESGHWDPLDDDEE